MPLSKREPAMGEFKSLYYDIVFAAGDYAGVNALFRYINRKKLLILYYHGICKDGFDLLKGYDERHLPQSLFRSQLEYLKKHGYSFVTLTEAVQILQERKPIRERLVTLTFDDGFCNIVQNAYPIMFELGGKGCFYVVTDLIGTQQVLWTDWIETVIRQTNSDQIDLDFEGKMLSFVLRSKSQREKAMRKIKLLLKTLDWDKRCAYLAKIQPSEPIQPPSDFFLANWDELRSLDPNVLEIGSHTCSHLELGINLSEETLDHEIGRSKQVLEAALGRPIVHFCFPSGSYNDRVLAKLREHGYISAVSTHYGFNVQGHNLFLLNRLGITTSLRGFKCNVSGMILLFKYFADPIRNFITEHTL